MNDTQKELEQLEFCTQYPRKNNKNSWFQLYKTDTEDYEKGVYLVTHKDNKPLEFKLISSVIYINKRIESNNYLNDSYKNMYEVVVLDRSKEQKFIVQAKDLFDTSFNDNDFYKSAANSGLVLWDNNKRLLLEYLKLQDEQAEIIQGVENIGWSDGDYYVSGFSTSEKNVVFTGSDRNGFKTNGTKEGQFEFIKDVLSEYPLVFFIFAYTQGGFFNRFLNEDHNQVLEVVGESSRGKSTAGRLCMSTYTDPSNFASFNMTKMSITETLKYYNDNFIYFDEIGEMKVREEERTELVYTLANAITKSRTKRLNKDGDFTTEKQTRLFYSLLLGGEVSILKNIKKTGGLEARLCQIVLDKNTHLFENVDSEFIENFNLELSKNYGWLAPELINSIKASKDSIQEMYIKNLEFVRDRYKINSVIENRKIKILAYTYLSAVYITNIIFDKEEEKEEKALLIEHMLDQAYAAIFKNVSYGTEADDQFKNTLSSIELTHTKHFNIFEGISQVNTDLIKEFYGEIHKTSTHKEIRIISGQIEQFCNSVMLDKDRLLSYISEHGFSITDKEKGRRTKKIKGVNYFVFRIPLAFFEDEDEVAKDITDTVYKPKISDEELMKDNPFDQGEGFKPKIKL